MIDGSYGECGVLGIGGAWVRVEDLADAMTFGRVDVRVGQVAYSIEVRGDRVVVVGADGAVLGEVGVEEVLRAFGDVDALNRVAMGFREPPSTIVAAVARAAEEAGLGGGVSTVEGVASLYADSYDSIRHLVEARVVEWVSEAARLVDRVARSRGVSVSAKGFRVIAAPRDPALAIERRLRGEAAAPEIRGVAEEVMREFERRRRVYGTCRVLKILIVTHPPPRHVDDALAVSLLMHLYRDHDVEIAFARSAEEAEAVLREKRPDIGIVVDTGKRYAVGGRVRWYDHHQDRSLPCSLVLVMRHEAPQMYSVVERVPKLRRLFDYISARDCRGPLEANREFGIEDPDLVVSGMMVGLITPPEPSPAIGERVFDFVEGYRLALEQTEVYNVGGLRIAVCRERKCRPAAIFDVTGADIAVVPNPWRESNTSFVRNDSSPLRDSIDLRRLGKLWNLVFVHSTGFLAVVEAPIDEVAERIMDVGRILSPEAARESA